MSVCDYLMKAETIRFSWVVLILGYSLQLANRPKSLHEQYWSLWCSLDRSLWSFSCQKYLSLTHTHTSRAPLNQNQILCSLGKLVGSVFSVS